MGSQSTLRIKNTTKSLRKEFFQALYCITKVKVERLTDEEIKKWTAKKHEIKFCTTERGIKRKNIEKKIQTNAKSMINNSNMSNRGEFFQLSFCEPPVTLEKLTVEEVERLTKKRAIKPKNIKKTIQISATAETELPGPSTTVAAATAFFSQSCNNKKKYPLLKNKRHMAKETIRTTIVTRSLNKHFTMKDAK